MSENDTTDLEAELVEIEAAIAKRKTLLGLVKETRGDLKQRSDFGWFMTLCEEEFGTILAVSSGIKAREWGEVEDKIEKDIIKLEIEQKILRREIARNS